jgi:hypothetical protein
MVLIIPSVHVDPHAQWSWSSATMMWIIMQEHPDHHA